MRSHGVAGQARIIKTAFFLIIFFQCTAWHAAQESKSADTQNHERAECFYEQLKSQYPEIDSQTVQIYYKNLQPVVLESRCNEDYLSPMIVRSADNKELVCHDGKYECDDISFGIHAPEHDKNSCDLKVAIEFSDHSQIQRCYKESESFELFLPKLEKIEDLANQTVLEKIWWRKKIKLYVILRNPLSHKASRISFELTRLDNHTVSIEGIAFVLNTLQETTQAFLDCSQADHLVINSIDPVFSYQHTKTTIDKTLYCTHQHKLFECKAKDVIGYFASVNMRRQWIASEDGFYDCKKNVIVPFVPSCYRSADFYPETPKEPLHWIFGLDEEHDSFYQLPDTVVVQENNKYMYHRGQNLWSLMNLFQVDAQEYLLPSNVVKLQGLSSVEKPLLSMDKDIVFNGGHQAWPQGIYEKNQSPHMITWRKLDDDDPYEIEQIVSENPQLIDLNYGLYYKNFDLYENFTAQESKTWCNLAQQFLYHFAAKVQRVDDAIITNLPNWNKLTTLQVSRIIFDSRTITKVSLLHAVQKMKQLKNLNFSYNQDIHDFNESYDNMAARCSNLFSAVGQCITQLKELEVLSIQGLWLQGQSNLKVTCAGQLTKEVAITTGIINHLDRKGITSIIDGIKSLPKLKTLSIDGIPSQGASFAMRCNGGPATFLSTFFILTNIDAEIQ